MTVKLNPFTGDLELLPNNLTDPVPIANGGTGQTTASSAFHAITPTVNKGDIIYDPGTAGGPVALGIGTQEQILAVSSAGVPYWNYPNSLRQKILFDEDYIGSTAAGKNAWTSAVSGTGATVNANGVGPDSSHIGVIAWQTGTTSTGYAMTYLGISQWLFNNLSAGTAYYYESLIQLSALSNGTDTYSIFMGWGDSSTGAAPVDGVGFAYSSGVNSGNFQLIAYANSVATTLNTTVAPTAGAWIRLGILVNVDAGTAQAFINGVSAGTINSGLPSGVGRFFGLNNQIVKSAGTTNCVMYVDYTTIMGWFLTARSN